MNKYILPITLFVLSLSSRAQEKIDTAVISKIKMEAMTRSHLPTIAHYLTEVSGPRLTNSPGYKRASTWAVSQLKKWGLTNATLESYGEFGTGWELEKSYVAMTIPYYQPLIAYPRAWTPGTNGPTRAQVIVIDRNDTTFIAKNPGLIKNKVVLLKSRDTTLHSQPFKPSAIRYSDSALARLTDQYMFKKEEIAQLLKPFAREKAMLAQLKSAGALAILFKGPGSDGTTFVDGRYSYKKGFDPILPEIVVSPEDYLKLLRLAKSNILEIEMDIKTKFDTQNTEGYNVVAEIKGSDPNLKDELVMLGGHLDSWHAGTGATDNAAGCAVMMEAVRILKALNLQPRRTIRIVLWGGEEQVLLGSFNYVKNHFADPAVMKLKPEHSKVSAYYNLDFGTGKIRGIYLQNNEAARPIFQKWLEPFAKLGASTVTFSNAGGTDHLSFDAVGIPAFQFIQDEIDYQSRTHHSNMDTYDHLMMSDLKFSAAVVASFVYNTAMRQEKLPRKELPQPEKFIFDADFD